MRVLRAILSIAILTSATSASAGGDKSKDKGKGDDKWKETGPGRYRYVPGGIGGGDHHDSDSHGSGFKFSGGGFSGWSFKEHKREPAPYTSQLGAGKKAGIDTLLKQETRPTIAEMEQTLHAAYGGMPKSNPFGKGTKLRGQARDLANLIAQLELAYPGGTYLPLGRDAVLIADVLDAYYRSIGQPDRVRRLDASGTSFPHYRNANERTYEEDRPIITGFLQTNGMDYDKLTKDRPFVMIDVTGYMSTSQSRQLMRSAYRSWAAMGKDPKELFDKVNFVGIGGGRHSISDAVAGDIEETKAKLKAGVDKDGPSDILYLGGGATHGLTYTTAWHSDFRDFTPQGGKVVTKPGHPAGEGTRLDVLEELYDVATTVTTPDFHKTVQDVAAKEYGYVFPSQRTSTLTRTATQPVKTKRTYEFGSSRPSLTSIVVKEFKGRLKEKPSVETAIEFLKDISGMYGRKTFSKYDVREAVRDIHAVFDLKQEAVQAAIREIDAKHPGFAEQVAKGLEPKAERKVVEEPSWGDWGEYGY